MEKITKRCTKCGESNNADTFPAKSQMCSSCVQLKYAQYYQKNKERIKERVKTYRINNQEKIKEARFKRCRKEETQRRMAKHKDRLRIEKRMYKKRKIAEDILYRTKVNAGASLSTAFRRVKNSLNTQPKYLKHVGCNGIELYAHLVQSALIRYGYYADTAPSKLII